MGLEKRWQRNRAALFILHFGLANVVPVEHIVVVLDRWFLSLGATKRRLAAGVTDRAIVGLRAELVPTRHSLGEQSRERVVRLTMATNVSAMMGVPYASGSSFADIRCAPR